MFIIPPCPSLQRNNSNLTFSKSPLIKKGAFLLLVHINLDINLIIENDYHYK